MPSNTEQLLQRSVW